MKRKLIALLTTLTISLAAAGCAARNPEPSSPSDTQEETPSDNQAQESEEEPLSEEAVPEDSLPEDSLLSEMIKIWGTVTSADASGITVDNQSENSSLGEMILVADSSQNTILDAVTGFPVSLEEIESGSSFEAYLGPAMTMSLPPQTNPYLVIVNIPQDYRAPQYVIAAKDPVKEDGMLTLQAWDGTAYQIPEDVEITPFLTKNIVRLEDIAAGSRCLIWLDENDLAIKVVLFAE